MIIGMMAMMDICIRVRNMDSGYAVSSIGVRPNTMRTRRSLIGKIFHSISSHSAYTIDHRNGLNNETTPIYSVTAPRSPSPTDGVSDIEQFASTSSASTEGTQVSSELKPYHEQESKYKETTSNVTNEAKMTSATSSKCQSNDEENIISSFPDDESPILNNILAGNTSSHEAIHDSRSAHLARASSRSCDGNGQIPNEEESALDKCEQTNLELSNSFGQLSS